MLTLSTAPWLALNELVQLHRSSLTILQLFLETSPMPTTPPTSLTKASDAPRMTRAHFAFIAAAIAALPETSREEACRTFANRLGACNASFDRNRFVEACKKP